MAKKYILLLCLFIVNAFAAHAQSLNGVYVGAELYNTPFDGMQIDNLVFYFKSDGTFNDALNQADWKTKTTGSYSIKNGIVQLNFKNGDESKRYKLAANGNLESTAGIKHTLHKVKKVTTIPAGVYEKRSASTSGGTGTPMIGAFSSNLLYIDGKGNFSTDRSGVVGIGGDAAGGTVGGKFEKNGKTRGTYKLGDGEITLTFGDGTVSKQSFFYSPPNEEDLILLNGEFYFRDDEMEKPAVTSHTDKNTKTPAGAATSGTTPAPATILAKLRLKYGGDSIDKINTIRETANITGNMQMVAITDLANNRVRAEIRQNGKLLIVKQLEGNNGWQLMNGRKKALSQDEKDELELNQYQGILGLHKKFSTYFLNATVTPSGGDYIVTFYKNKNKVIYLVGNDYTLKGNAYSINAATPGMSVYKNFVKANGITYPAVTESQDGKNKLTSTTTAVEFNPILNSDDWKMP